ncbi:unnamed protein product, partial [Mesorhabditis spiculigera]
MRVIHCVLLALTLPHNCQLWTALQIDNETNSLKVSGQKLPMKVEESTASSPSSSTSALPQTAELIIYCLVVIGIMTLGFLGYCALKLHRNAKAEPLRENPDAAPLTDFLAPRDAVPNHLQTTGDT